MSTRSAASADDPVAREAAEDILLGGGSALGAALAGFFAAAGAHGGVLLSSVTLLVGGLGAGARAFDGRLRQPGLGTKRPRGFRPGEPIPDAARVAVPAAVPALMVALSYDDELRLGRLLKAAIRRARASGAESRATFLEELRAVGAAAVTGPSFIRPILHVAGEAEGGLVTPTDLRSVTDIDHPALAFQLGDHRLLGAPWANDPELDDSADYGVGHAVCAVDARGVFVALAYRRVVDGITVEELELEAPANAIPVRRGVPRVGPGKPLPAPAPVALRVDASGAPIEALAVPRARILTAAEVAHPPVFVRLEQDGKRAVAARL